VINTVRVTLPDLRPTFRINELPIIRANRFHTHPESAAERTAASAEIGSIVRKAGFNPYFVSMAHADQRDDERGCRYYYWPKDLKADFRDDVVQDDDVLVFIDVDFHCPMEQYMKLGQPIIMYTVVPDQAAYQGKEHSYMINNNSITYNVTGGAIYKHKIWDYDQEVLACDDDEGYTWFYNVEQRNIDGCVGGGRRIISLLPFTKIDTRYAYLINPVYLRRKTYTREGVNTVYNNITDSLSLALNGSYQSVNSTGRRIEAIRQRLMAKQKAPFTIGDIEQYLYDETDNKTTTVKVEASLLYSIFAKSIDIQPKSNVISTSDIVCSYTPVGPIVCDEPKIPCNVLTTPVLAQPGMFPTKSVNSELSAINGRITKVANFKIPAKKYSTYAREFVRLTVPQANQGQPIDMQTVIDMQNKPLQRARTAKVLDFLGISAPNRLKTFNKPESYASANDPRIITTCSPGLTLEMSRFTYAFKRDVLKHHDWYGPGKTPNRSIKILRKLCIDGAIETDFTRFDGSISKFLQERIVFESYLRWVNIGEKSLMLNYLRSVFVKNGKTSSGIKYAAGWGTRSGSPITTDGNTLINAYISFAALREMGFSAEQAYKKLGIYAGDDGINRVYDGFLQTLKDVCKDLGLDVKIEIQGVNKPLSYLSRIFPAILTHDDSYQDPMRTLSKIHLSANKNVTREQAATNKAVGYLITDSKTPLISHYCKKVLEITRLEGKNFLSEELFRIENGAWPQQNHDLIEASFCSKLNISTSELSDKVKLIEDCNSLDKMPLLFNNTVEHKIDAVTDDGLVLTRTRKNDRRESRKPKSGASLDRKPTAVRPDDRNDSKCARGEDGSSHERLRLRQKRDVGPTSRFRGTRDDNRNPRRRNDT